MKRSEAAFSIDARSEIDQLGQLRQSASNVFAVLLWLHVPVVASIANANRLPLSDIIRLAGFMALAALAGSLAARTWSEDWKARCTIAGALTFAPMLMVAAASGNPWQIDFHMYFFVVFGMLVAFVDWRPIAVAATLTAAHHLILSYLYPAAVFPDVDGGARVVLHVAIVGADLIVLLWIVRQMKRLFRRSIDSLEVARVALSDAEMLRAVVVNVSDAVIISEFERDGVPVTADRRIIYVNDAFTRITGYEASAIVGGDLAVLYGERTDQASISASFEEVLKTGSARFAGVWYSREQREIDVEASIVGIASTEANIVRSFSIVRDVTELHQARNATLRAKIVDEINTTLKQEISDRIDAEKRLAFAAFHDELTALPNRAYFRERVNEALARAGPGRPEPAVLFVDLDRFKLVNDGLGHHNGDLLLVAVAKRLKATLRDDDTLARLGGDEFAVSIARPTDKHELDLIAHRMLSALASPFEVSGVEMVVSASIGIANGRLAASDDADDVLRNADLAMYRAKALGRGRYEHFVPELLETSTRLLQLDTQLRHAVERGELTTFFQPILRLSDRRLCGFEALVRWRHPIVGLIAPSEFIAIAEDTGLIVELGQFVLEASCAQLRSWLDAWPQHADLWVSVNVSPVQLRAAGYVTGLVGTLRRHGLRPEQLHLEITESTIVSDFDFIARLLAEIRQYGVRISVDDFGTGFSSLQYLDKLPIDTLKIDRSFISGRGDGIANLKLVRTIVNLANDLDLALVSEGVETESQAEILCTLTRGYGQGYLFSRPLEAAATRHFFETERTAQALIAKIASHPAPNESTVGSGVFLPQAR